jgi:hypothetical protein
MKNIEWKSVGFIAAIVIVTLIILHSVGPATLKTYTGTT